MFNVNGGELLLIVVLFILLFGPERVPEVAAQLGKALREIRQLTDSSTAELRRELELAARELNQAAPPAGRALPLGSSAEPGAAAADTRPGPSGQESGAVPAGPVPDPVEPPAPAPSIFRKPAEPDDRASAGQGAPS